MDAARGLPAHLRELADYGDTRQRTTGEVNLATMMDIIELLDEADDSGTRHIGLNSAIGNEVFGKSRLAVPNQIGPTL
ncbi:hypothetical protein M1247_25835 [Mycobacterium sp. 21AC1]|uniref:hypothetical protein n=1 Tax=[Mycobacterium] appelbergii TaxID=2939269 RepID=UPI002938CF46|nr:hypothetical protein [Mycobacterium sp. 21AC1]MDV3128359.1 hypothetical protein [Mycobacterium sp. 21AC1]